MLHKAINVGYKLRMVSIRFPHLLDHMVVMVSDELY